MKKINPAPPRERTSERIGMTLKPKKLMGAYFQLTSDELVSLREIRAKLNGVSKENVSQSKTIRALIQLGVGTDSETLLESLRKIL